MNQKGFVNVILIGAVVLLIGLGGYFAVIKKYCQETFPPKMGQQDSRIVQVGEKLYFCETFLDKLQVSISQPKGLQNVTNSLVTTQVDTSNWKTYTNDFLAFSVKYPQAWTVKEDNKSYIAGPIVNFYPPNPDLPENYFTILFDTRTFKDIAEIKVFYERLDKEPLSNYKHSFEKTIIDGQEAYMVLRSDLPNYRTIYLFRNNKIYNFEIQYNSEEVQQILSTFEFTNQVDNSKSELEIITNLKTNWQSIQVLIPFRPGHPGTTSWGSPTGVQFIGNNNLLVCFEDGYMANTAMLNYNNGQFKILETFKNQGDFISSDWENLIKKYGDLSYPIGTYTISLVRNNQGVSFKNLTKVPENVFLKNYFTN